MTATVIKFSRTPRPDEACAECGHVFERTEQIPDITRPWIAETRSRGHGLGMCFAGGCSCLGFVPPPESGILVEVERS